ncbi:hypothetical protein VTO42DRAFT_2856 [Malbranchea cinnamomea]
MINPAFTDVLTRGGWPRSSMDSIQALTLQLRVCPEAEEQGLRQVLDGYAFDSGSAQIVFVRHPYAWASSASKSFETYELYLAGTKWLVAVDIELRTEQKESIELP